MTFSSRIHPVPRSPANRAKRGRSPWPSQPTFAAPGEKPRFCSKHKSEGHVNVRHKLCRHPGCKLVPTYGAKGTRVPVACLEHSSVDMVDIKRERMRMSQVKKAQRSVATVAGGVVVQKTGVRAGVNAGVGASTAVAAAGRKRARGQSLGGNVGVGRKIADAIFTSSQRVLAVEETAAMDESEWEGESEEEEEESESGEESEEGEGATGQDQGSTSGRRSVSDPSPLAPLPTALAFSCAPLGAPPAPKTNIGKRYGSHMPLPLSAPVFPFPPPTEPSAAKTNGGQQRLPFHKSPLALLPEVFPRDGTAGQALQMVAAVAAVASAAEAAAQHEADAVAQGEEGQGMENCARKEVSKERPSVTLRRMLPGFTALGGTCAGGDGNSDGGGDGGNGGSRGDSVDTRSGKASSADSAGGPSASSSPPCVGSRSTTSAPAQQSTPSSARAPAPRTGAPPLAGRSAEGNLQVSYGAGTLARTGATGMGTSLSWKCILCRGVIGANDRYVLVCCGHGLLHKACTAAFVGRLPCPKCWRPVSSSLKVFM